MSVSDSGVMLGHLAIEHFQNPGSNAAEVAIDKLLAETQAKDMKAVLSEANQNSGKISIYPETDKKGNVEKVDITFHPLFSLRALGKDLSIDLSELHH